MNKAAKTRILILAGMLGLPPFSWSANGTCLVHELFFLHTLTQVQLAQCDDSSLENQRYTILTRAMGAVGNPEKAHVPLKFNAHNSAVRTALTLALIHQHPVKVRTDSHYLTAVKMTKR